MLGKIASYIRGMQLFYQMCHHLTKGALFFQDHEAFNRFYNELSENYDAVAERAVNLEGDESIELKAQLKDIFQHLKDKPTNVKENKEYFLAALDCEKNLCDLINAYNKQEGIGEGCKNLLGGIADQSDVRQYLMNRRIK